MRESNGAEVLDSITKVIRRFVALSESQLIAIALWVVHTHCLEAADATPYLAITSAEKQSGKTRLLEVLETLVAKPWLTGRVPAAVLTRKIDAEKPTLLLDESDAAFGGEKEYAEALRGVLNTGHRRGGKASCCVGQGQNTSYRDFSTYCAKAIAGIGKLPDTVADRAIPIRLKRAAPTEKVERFRRRDIESQACQLKKHIQQWCGLNRTAMQAARPHFPEKLTDRQEDGAEPLLAIADAAAGDWPGKARTALVELWTRGAAEDDSIQVRLLTDIYAAFDNRQEEKLPSADLLEELYKIETSPWLELNHGKAMTSIGLARLLKPFDIAPRTIKLSNGSTLKGYQREWFQDAWNRYLRPAPCYRPTLETSPPSPHSVYAVQKQLVKPSLNVSVTPSKTDNSSANTGMVTEVTVRSLAARRCYVHGEEALWWERPPGSGDWLCGKCHPRP